MADIFAIDFGTGSALQIWGPNGLVSKRNLQLARIPGGKSPRDEFIMILRAILLMGDAIVESPSVGSSGAEVADVQQVVEDAAHTLYTVSARAVIGYRRDHGLPRVTDTADGHVEDARIIYKIATEQPWRLRVWHRPVAINRHHSSVRPMDKRKYRDERSDEFMARLPAFASLPLDLQKTIGTGGGYSRSLIMPFAMALTEPAFVWAYPENKRTMFMKILGAYDHGYPSFYRRMVIDWMQENAKSLAGVTRMQEVPRHIRKQALTMTQRQIRTLLYLALQMQDINQAQAA